MKSIVSVLSVVVLSVFALSAFAEEHKHVHHAPHKGTLIEIGEHFANLELVFDSATGQISLFSLDAHCEKPVRLAQKSIELKILKGEGIAEEFTVTVLPVENELSGEKAGDTSEFAAKSDKLKGLKSWDAVVVALRTLGKDFKEVKFNFPKGND